MNTLSTFYLFIDFCEELRLDKIFRLLFFYSCHERINSFKENVFNKHYVPDIIETR